MIEKNRLILLILIIPLFLIAIMALLNRPRVPTDAQNAAPTSDPLANPILLHMITDGELTADHPSTQTLSVPELTVERQGDRIAIHLSEELLHRLGPTSLIDLSLTEPEALFTHDRYLRFIDDLDKLIHTQSSKDHSHETEHEE